MIKREFKLFYKNKRIKKNFDLFELAKLALDNIAIA